jgi:hypothetical protein
LERLAEGASNLRELALLAISQYKEAQDQTYWDGRLQGMTSTVSNETALREEVDRLAQDNAFLRALVRDFNKISFEK